MIDAGTFGSINWTDLSTPDISASVEFYRELFDWTVDVQTTGMGDYYVGKVGDVEAAGMMAQDPSMAGAPPAWTTFVYVEDIAATTRRVAAAGGRVDVEPFAIPGDAQVAVVSDPTGAMFALISGGEQPHGAYLSMDHGRVCWFELLTRDPASAGGFYLEAFDWKAVTEASSTGGDYTMFKLADQDVAGMMAMPAEVPAEAPAHWTPYFAVDSCADAGARAVELGARLLVPATKLDIGHFAIVEDPLGAKFNLMDVLT